jgi:uncharacterized membrane protein YdjX (TVP38/TMEM64 family)
MPLKISSRQKKLLVALAIAGIGLLLVAGFFLRHLDVRGFFERGMAILRDAGPWVFYTAMALLPAIGFPVMAFSLTAGSAFSERMGTGGVIAAGIAASTVNLILTYWLARWAIRPWLSRLLERMGYRLPKMDATDLTDLIILLRVTPGTPFFIQNYLLGLADAPFWRYLFISCATNWTYTAAFIFFGDALLHGRGKLALVAISSIVALVAATHLLRRRYGRKKTRGAECLPLT